MKYHIDTIPVWDAFRSDAECPLCLIYKQSESNYVESFLGGSVMEPDTRIEVNEKGFCPNHFHQLFDAQNRLGLALLAHTHTKEILKSYKEWIKKINCSLKAKDSKGTMTQLLNRFSKEGSPYHKNIAGLESFLREKIQSCIICERLSYNMKRYVYTLIYLWEKEEEFRKVLQKSKGLCLPHFTDVLNMASDELITQKLTSFIEMLLEIQQSNLERVEKELEWFTLKFDYRNNDKPWGNSKDALPRTINKLIGQTVNEE